MKQPGKSIDDFLFSTGLVWTLALCVLEVFSVLTTGAARDFFVGIGLGIGLSFMLIGWSRGGRFYYSWRGTLVGMPTSITIGAMVLGATMGISFANSSPLDTAHIVFIGIYLLGIIVGMTLIARGIRRMETAEISSANQQKSP